MRNPSANDEDRGENASRHARSLLAVNLGKNKDSPADSIADFVAGVKTFGPYSDVLVVNVSSPNTPGLRSVPRVFAYPPSYKTALHYRDLQNRQQLEDLLTGVKKARDELPTSSHRKTRLLVKVAPDLNESQLADMAEVIRRCDVDGVIVSNTTTQRPPSLLDGESVAHLLLWLLRPQRRGPQRTRQRQVDSPVPP
jgi:dihydroorotate dehydrogenase